MQMKYKKKLFLLKLNYHYIINFYFSIMNIFVLDNDIQINVQYYANKHVNKMLLETAQLLSTAHRVLDEGDVIDQRLYKKTHINHPCSKWVRQTKRNYIYGYELFKSLNGEFEYRFEKKHLSWTKLGNVLQYPPKNIPQKNILTPFAQAMPEKYKSFDAVKAYRAYYIGEKQHLFVWSKRDKPRWIQQKRV